MVLNFAIVALSSTILAGILAISLVKAFSLGEEAGIRSLAATILPFTAITYIIFFSRSYRPTNKIPDGILYFLFTFWTTALFALSNFLFSRRIPVHVGEFTISLTICLLIFIFKHYPLRSLFSCSYGVVSGFLLYIFLFGLPNLVVNPG
ncbi:MAG: hypothetical protein HC866_07435 [Leptolyngbyaceae cyanobacterium RU_5_1]|nr:hypothetical protein [Leptolyngbyaceae cyanobacterium RU_5_1]